MTVAELIAELQGMDQNAPVHICYNYGDHWRTMVAPKARCVEGCEVVYSEYHRMDKLSDADDATENKSAVVITASSSLNF